ncbi:MAG: hypothetical protein WC661_02820 [Opitutaceae bacterium]
MRGKLVVGKSRHGLGIEFGNELPRVFEIHDQRFSRYPKVRTGFFEEIALLFGISVGEQN